jgi:hypothetical protein
MGNLFLEWMMLRRRGEAGEGGIGLIVVVPAQPCT